MLKKLKTTKVWWNVCTFNMKGRGSQSTLTSKWSDINNMMKEDKISLLTLQETHLSKKHVDDIHNLYRRHLLVIHSEDPDHTTGKAGMAVVLNKNLVKTEGIKTTELIPGCALLVQIPWHADTTLNWLAMYASAMSKDENRSMWVKLKEMWSEIGLPQLDGLSGNFNFVEEAVDRLPAHEDDAAIVSAFQDFKAMLRLQNGWRVLHPMMKEYTFTRQSVPYSRSRIDHIYVHRSLLAQCMDWELSMSNVETDHHAALVQMSHPKVPYVDKGRWTMPLHLLRNKCMIKKVEGVLKEAGEEIKALGNGRTVERNPQKSIPIKKARMAELQAQIDNVLLDENLEQIEKLMTAALLQQRVVMLQWELNENCHTTNLVKAKLELETISKYWMNMGKPNAPRNMIQELKKPGTTPPTYVQ
ncbi:hypothetical protein IW262DRAFT_1468461 [Armillaria fumosa]|nr:hypothetical protein IW262DRAFT_1468461 [Armillaria fumosa]